MGNAKIDFSDVILKLEDINKSFPGVKALQHMQIELARGRCTLCAARTAPASPR